MTNDTSNPKYDFDLDPKNYKNSEDEWIRNLANNGLDVGMTADEIEYLIRKRKKEMGDYFSINVKYGDISGINKKDDNDLTLNQAFWNDV